MGWEAAGQYFLDTDGKCLLGGAGRRSSNVFFGDGSDCAAIRRCICPIRGRRPKPSCLTAPLPRLRRSPASGTLLQVYGASPTPKRDHRNNLARGGNSWTWQQTRAAVLKRDGHRCVACGATGVRFAAYHVSPLAMGGSNELQNLRTLCVPGRRLRNGRHGQSK